MRGLTYYILCLTILFGCNSEPSQKLLPTSHSNFTELEGKSIGLDFSNDLISDTKLNILEYLYYYNGGGVGVGDFDGDGLEDVYFTANQGQDRIFKNLGDLQFEDVTQSAGLQIESTWSSGVAVVDIDNDNDLDIYVSKVAPVSSEDCHNLLYINQGDFTFTEQSAAFGLDFSGYGTQALFLDYDKDGDNDVYLINHSIHSVRSFGKTSQRKESDEVAGDRFYENVDGKFVDITSKSGIFSSALGYGLSGSVHDFNEDGYPDIYICNDFHENDYLYINDGSGGFKESSTEWFSQTSKFSMGVDIADINGDSEMDLFTTDMQPWKSTVAMKSGGEDTDKIFQIRTEIGFEPQYARNHMHIKDEDRFLELALYTDTYATDWSWAVLCQDFDHNGLTDIFISNGIVKRPNDLDYMKFLNKLGNSLEDSISTEELKSILEVMPSEKISNVLFNQNSKLKFSSIQNSLIGKPTFSNGAAYADFDGDGDLDIVTNNLNSQASFYRNDTKVKDYIAFQLKSDDSALGTKIEVETTQKSYINIYNPIRGYQSTSSHSIHFPLTESDSIKNLLVTWPNGQTKSILNLGKNKKHTIDPSAGSQHILKEKKRLPEPVSMSELNALHLDNEYADYDYDILIPEKLSKEGPAIHAADFTGDGIKDLYIGGGRFSAAKIYKGLSNGKYQELENTDFNKDNKYEDVSAASLDFDNDGDLDLYVVSGGNDVKELNDIIQDRLYINQGNGDLKRLPVSLPHTNGSTVSTGDINGDGYPEIFVGARSIPNAYGLSPYSFLLSSRQGLGIDLVWKKRLGMITSSEIIDLNSDDKNDLVVCGDWTPILVGINQGSEVNFVNTYSKSINSLSGLWNSLHFEDINKDGTLDILAGNAGLNFKWKVDKSNATMLYIVDMDENGSTEPIIFTDYFGQSMPFHSLDKMAQQVPALRKKYLKYSDFIKVDQFKDLTDKNFIESKSLTELKSAIFLSQDSTYVMNAMPDYLQYTSIKDMTMFGNRIYYIGNEDRFITELGDVNGMSAGSIELNYEDSLVFINHRYLDIDPNLKTRQLDRLAENKFALSAYKSKPLIIQIGVGINNETFKVD